ncbi:hypothetical protein [Aliagarivorans marinus]|uniref:hypothetical protein n=1 Tax=Aliagarivorans marinus TaxID=561965 RepID=UPI00041585BA|nr:hypothetical protein [Aliagarivorans marinus]
MYRKFGYQQGIALIQVLLMTAIISVLAMQMAYSAKSKVTIAQSLRDRVLAEVKLRDAESELLFALSTLPWDATSAEGMSARWNFYGKPFSYGDGISIRIQDSGGLISLFNGGDSQMVDQVLQRVLGDRQKARLARAQIIDAQGYHSEHSASELSGQMFQSYSELTQALGQLHVPVEHHSMFTRMPYGAFLPLYAPDAVLKHWLSEGVAESIIEARSEGRLTQQLFTQFTGLYKSDDLMFYPSGSFLIELVVEEGASRAKNNLFVSLSPLSNTQPIRFFGAEG